MDRFETSRLVAERFTKSDEDDLRRLYSHPEVAAWLTVDGEPLSEAEVQRRVIHHLDHWKKHHFGAWMLRDKITNDFVGYCGLKYARPDGKDEVELFYALLPQWWKMGLATEVARTALAIADELQINEVVCFTLPWNQASRNVMEKLGFHYEKDIEHAGLPHVFYRRRSALHPNH